MGWERRPPLPGASMRVCHFAGRPCLAVPQCRSAGHCGRTTEHTVPHFTACNACRPHPVLRYVPQWLPQTIPRQFSRAVFQTQRGQCNRQVAALSRELEQLLQWPAKVAATLPASLATATGSLLLMRRAQRTAWRLRACNPCPSAVPGTPAGSSSRRSAACCRPPQPAWTGGRWARCPQ